MNEDDGHYPRIKPYSEYDQKDVSKLITLGKWDEVKKVIASIDIGTPTSHLSFVQYLAGMVHDKSLEATEELEARLRDIGMEITPLMHNYFL